MNQELVDKYRGRTLVKNVITKDMQIRLRTREYDFSRSLKAVKTVDQQMKDIKMSSDNRTFDSPSAVSMPLDSKEIKTNRLDSVPALIESCSQGRTDVTTGSSDGVNASSDILEAVTASENNSKISQNSDCNAEPTVTTESFMPPLEKSIGCVTDEDIIRLRPPEKMRVS